MRCGESVKLVVGRECSCAKFGGQGEILGVRWRRGWPFEGPVGLLRLLVLEHFGSGEYL